MEEDFSTIPKHLENWKLIYRSECHMSSNIAGDAGYGPDSPDMVSVAIRVKQDKTSVNVKDLTSDDKIKVVNICIVTSVDIPCCGLALLFQIHHC